MADNTKQIIESKKSHNPGKIPRIKRLRDFQVNCSVKCRTYVLSKSSRYDFKTKIFTMKSSEIVKLTIFLLLVNFSEFCNSETESETNCQWPAKDKPSIVIRGGAGRLGNMLFSYLILVGMKVRFQLNN